MNKRANTCIRVFADKNQIIKCKDEISLVKDSIETTSNVLSLTGNKVRLKILYLLNSEIKMCPCDLSDVLDMTVPAISQHLRKLKDGGIITNVKVGQTVFYSLVDQNLGIIKSLLDDLSSKNQIETHHEFI
jgi:DNA-binding transcriptional ArsR family regulator